MQSDPIQGQGHEPVKDGNSAIIKGYLLPHLQWGLANDHAFLHRAKYLKLIGAGFLIFVLVFVSRDFELGTVRRLRGVDRQSHMGLIFIFHCSKCRLTRK